MPAVLVEIGFGTNRADARFVTSPASQGVIARAITDATIDYLNRHARRMSGGNP